MKAQYEERKARKIAKGSREDFAEGRFSELEPHRNSRTTLTGT
jgi:hypothetical protein